MTDVPVPQTTQPLQTLRMAGGLLHDVLLGQVRTQVAALKTAPRLMIVQVGHNLASTVYVGRKLKAAAKVGILAEVVEVAAEAGEGYLQQVVVALAKDPAVTAMIVQLPLPAGYDAWKIMDVIPPQKDCDGLTTANALLRRGGDGSAIAPATPLGVMRLLVAMQVNLVGQRVAVLGRSRVVGGPLREMLRAAGADVLEINRDTPQPASLCRSASVVCSAMGVPHLLDETWIGEGAVVVDVGLVRGADGSLQGDVHPLRVQGIARALTPVPGGVGPLTVASLLTNVVDCACLQQGVVRPVWHVLP